MSKDVRLHLDESAIADLAESRDMEDLLDDVGDQVASLAEGKAPKLSGEGAASIHGEVDRDAEGLYVDVSWDADHFYMLFAEVGTERQPATPFLRPALNQADI